MKIINGTIAAPAGFYADGFHSGLKRKRKDIGWIYSKYPAQAAGVFTTNAVQAAPIQVTKGALASDTIQAIVVNSGNANACTGKNGILHAQEMQRLAAEKLSIPTDAVAVASTGVIGQELPMGKIKKGILGLYKTEGTPQSFHEAILTTDTRTKEIVVEGTIGGTKVTMAGVAKGSGMIHPNMATMLAFITTDAVIEKSLLQEALKKVTDRTFNQITVDGDTSTNDMVLLLANGAAGHSVLQKETADYDEFTMMLSVVMEELAKMIAQDGEGATKLIEANVIHGKDQLTARMIAKKIVGSSLVKTAMFGADPNWGRIICAIGYADPSINPEKVNISIGGLPVLLNSQPQSFEEMKMREILVQDKIVITVDLQEGTGKGTAWGCDLTYKYVEINALYHT
ncbi:bifunctional glutamate N-acetyltransferase/amino-acid acetyltransferase ArgJ [Enterococcus sp. BWR-S5]|uniref:bifunctional glutamate N-acetyltransferase/amino-acid acetyltransferase ArgJ n=1 Tax=Enterococcus sp. BWR-S5 TaxID=2787714 RepID=UPI00192509ED|nr:bifunctional glutamate N-acetyltransferase/amino-acid acetyltransferase ArgJ [Enterococcus sp. BWR-S5]MBL1227006.1 bifunctional glutamate N-acetyltransferase/amino-acid acetyltransferase ArgJ [Enterococcus sp. BWR-S5]